MLKQTLILLTLFLLPAISHAVESNEAIALELQEVQNNIQMLPTSETDPTHVNQNELKLMGRGIITKHSKEALGLTCVGDTQSNECEVLRFVHFTDVNANYIGPKFKIKSLPALKRSLKRLNSRSNNRRDRGAWVMGGAMILATILNPITHSFVPAYILLGATVALGLIPTKYRWDAIDFIQPMKNALASDSAVSVTNQNGWNWSTTPHKIRDSVFNRMITDITNENYLQYNTKRVTSITEN